MRFQNKKLFTIFLAVILTLSFVSVPTESANAQFNQYVTVGNSGFLTEELSVDYEKLEIIGEPESMEYRLATDDVWTETRTGTISFSGYVTEDSPEQMMLIRHKQGGDAYSEEYAFTIPARPQEPGIEGFDTDSKILSMTVPGEYEYCVGAITEDVLTDVALWISFSDTLNLSELLSVSGDPIVSIRASANDSMIASQYASITPGAVLNLPDFDSDYDFSDSQIIVMIAENSLTAENAKTTPGENGLFYGVEIDKQEILMELSDTAQGDNNGGQVILLTLKEDGRENVIEAVERLTLNAMVEYAQPDHVVELRATPNDTYYSSQQYNMPKISAPDAWDITTGSSSVVVGVLDTGIDYTHPDLADNMWVNPGEIPDDGIDNDGNGYIDDVYGWDFAGKNNDVMDGNGHGTHVAGIIGAVGDNSIGVTGVCWNVKLAAIKIFDSNGNGTLSGIIEGIQYAKNMGIDITNNSWGLDDDEPIIKQAIASYDGLFICAVTNTYKDIDSSPSYPESYASEYDTILSVANSDSNDTIISGYGANTVYLAAPGMLIYSTFPTSFGINYWYLNGASMAAPHVTGTAALLRSLDPTLTTSEIKDIILNSVDLVPGLSDKLITGGRLNVYKAVSQVTVSDNKILIENFVTRLYQHVLGRNPDTAGLNYWVNSLMNGTSTGADVSAGFIFSQEYTDQNTSDSNYVDMLYLTLMNRNSDSGGKQYWLNHLDNGVTRKYIFAGFINSQEFKDLCNTYQIQAGTYISTEITDQNPQITAFVSRMYTECLERSFEKEGLEYWTGQLLQKAVSGGDLAKNFFLSSEFTGKNHSHEKFVMLVYKTLLNRNADTSGLSYWMSQLDAGISRSSTIDGFIWSNEFGQLCASYGINR